MKKIILSIYLILLTASKVKAQEFADPFDISKLFESNKESNGYAISKLFQRSGGFSKNDLIVVLINEHYERGRVLCFGKKVQEQNNELTSQDNENLVSSYVPYDSTREMKDSHFRYINKIDNKLYHAVINCAWEISMQIKSEKQFQNSVKSIPGSYECYYLLCTSNFTESGERRFIGGYIADPQKDTKTRKFLDLLILEEKKWIAEIGKAKLSSTVTITRSRE